MKTIFITGSNGFVGSALACKLLHDKTLSILRTSRFNNDANHLNIDLTTDFSVESELSGVDVIIHCAARVHVMDDKVKNPLQAFRQVNTYGTLNLAQQAADAGVKRFIFISSIKVNGEATELGQPFKPNDKFIPSDPYGLSKYEAELGLHEIAKNTGLEVVIIRPPLIYGPDVKANFASMMKWMNKGLPLPLGGVTKNKRSLVSIDNLIDLIVTCIDHPKAANQTFLVSDDEDISTSQLLTNMATALVVPNRLLPVPSLLFTLAAKLIGKPAMSQRLCGSLQVDVSKTKQLLNWHPPYSSVECMKKTADAFHESLTLKNEK